MINESLLSEVNEISLSAGEVILNWYKFESIPHIKKTDDSPLTKADEEANDLILKSLKKTSSYPVVSEESLVDFKIRQNWGTFWLVDPLDGTKNFLNKDGEFTVNIALINDGKPILGVVYAPALNLLYSAIKEKGAKLNGCSIYNKSLRSEPIAAVSSMHGSDETTEFLSKAGINKVKPIGSALKLCKLAEGEVDIYPRFGPTSEWDIAAGHLIAAEGGGKIIDLKTLTEPVYNKPSVLNNFFIAAHRDFDLTGLI
jgi:3'(2'), 5'-bisphosphate nucleotidase